MDLVRSGDSEFESLVVPSRADAQNAAVDELSDEEQRQVQIAERFLTVLEKSPRRGTALDRIYGHHVEFGTLDEFLDSLGRRVKENPDDGVGWMLLGLFESQRGEDGAAIDAFKKAEEHRPDDPLASYYLGQSQLLLGQPEQAVEAFERAIERKPQRTDLLEIFQQLGRVHQRAQRDEEALAVWTRLEGLFPDDPRVQEQIAVTLVEEGEYALALPRYEKLAELVDDDYRRTMFQLEAAELKVREGQKEAGVADLESGAGEPQPGQLAASRSPPPDRRRLSAFGQSGRAGDVLRKMDRRASRRRGCDGAGGEVSGVVRPYAGGDAVDGEGSQARTVPV